jgi:hypothetical protein
MIAPSVGRVVWYHPTSPHEQPLAAHIAFVHAENLVNLMVIDKNGKPYPAAAVTLWQEGEPRVAPSIAYCEWMPYQKAVAHGEIAPNLHKN